MGNTETNKKGDTKQLQPEQENGAQVDPELFQALKDLDSSFLNIIESTNQIGIKLNSILEVMHQQSNKHQEKT